MSNEFKAALWTALFTFVTLFGTSVLGFVQALTDWASSDGTVDFPDVSTLGKAAVAAALAAVTGLINYVVRVAQSRQLLPGAGPQYPPA